MNDSDQKAEQWFVKIRLSASDPTSGPCQLRYSESLIVDSFATSSSWLLEIRCCIDRMKPQAIADKHKQAGEVETPVELKTRNGA
jgi:hypothetical protein